MLWALQWPCIGKKLEPHYVAPPTVLVGIIFANDALLFFFLFISKQNQHPHIQVI